MSAVTPSRLLWFACAVLLAVVGLSALLDPRFGGQDDFDPRDPLQLPLFGQSQRVIWVDPLPTDAGLLLQWSPVPGASDYDLVCYSPSRRDTELFREPAIQTPRFTLTREALPAGVASGTRLEAQIEARRKGVRIAVSDRRRVTMP